DWRWEHPDPQSGSSVAGVCRAGHDARAGPPALRLPARRPEVRGAAARGDRAGARPAGHGAGPDRQHPGRHRLPPKPESPGPEDGGPGAGGSQATEGAGALTRGRRAHALPFRRSPLMAPDAPPRWWSWASFRPLFRGIGQRLLLLGPVVLIWLIAAGGLGEY